MALNPVVGIVVSILCMAVTIVFGAMVVLRLPKAPWGAALVIATVANLLGKVLVSWLHWPASVSYALPTLAFFLLSQLFFRPTLPKLIGYWLAGFVAYMGLHVTLAVSLGWTFMFPFWKVVGR